MNFSNTQRGFTLVEMLIVIVIAGILFTVAIPSFTSSVLESHRDEAQKNLLKLKLQQESYRLDNTTYAGTSQLGFPTSDRYTYTVENVTATTYTLVANAKGDQLKDTSCKKLTLNQSMERTPAACW